MNQRKWLSELRKTQGLSQDKVAEYANINRSVYSRIESGERNPSVTTAQKIAEFLGFNWGIFFANHGAQSAHVTLSNTDKVYPNP